MLRWIVPPVSRRLIYLPISHSANDLLQQKTHWVNSWWWMRDLLEGFFLELSLRSRTENETCWKRASSKPRKIELFWEHQKSLEIFHAPLHFLIFHREKINYILLFWSLSSAGFKRDLRESESILSQHSSLTELSLEFSFPTFRHFLVYLSLSHFYTCILGLKECEKVGHQDEFPSLRMWRAKEKSIIFLFSLSLRRFLRTLLARELFLRKNIIEFPFKEHGDTLSSSY